MSEQNTNREKLAELIENARMPSGGTLLGSRAQFDALADAIFASDWLREHDAEVWDEAARNIAVSTTRNNAWPENAHRRGKNA